RFEAQGLATDASPRTSGKVWTTGANGIPEGTASFGPEIGLVRHVLGGGAPASWRNDAAPNLYILKQTEGGRSVDHFRWGGPGQDLILTALRQSSGETLTSLAAAKTVLIQGLIFVIGEKDSTTLHPSGASMAESLDVRFADWVRQIRAALGVEAPAVFVEIFDALDARKQTANARLHALAASIPNAAVIARDPSWQTVGDGIHYDAAAQAAIGDAVFAHFRQSYGRPGDGLVTGFPFAGLRPWFHVPPLFIDDGGTNMRIAATPAASGTIHALVTDADAPVPDAAAIRDASAAAPGFRKAVTADQEVQWWSGSGVFQSNVTQDCHFVLEDASGQLGEVATVRRWANAKFAPDLALVSTAGGAASFSARPAFTGDLSWALHAGARGFMRPEDVETAAFEPVDAGQMAVTANTDVQIDVTGLTPGQEYTLLVTGRKNGTERAVTQSATVIAA
ncbi:sialate O-acetylesterase, partial [Oceanicella actignis]